MVDEAVCGAWSRLRAGVDRDEFVARVGARALQDLLQSGAVEEVSVEGAAVGIESVLRIRIGGATALVAFQDAAIRERIEATVRHIRVPRSTPVDVYAVVSGTPRGCAISINGGLAATFAEEESAPGLRLLLTEAVLDLAGLIVLHAATLVGASQAMLVFGAPGAGKSTLSLYAAAESRLRLAGDDLAELRPGGRVRPLRFAAAVKRGSVELLSGSIPALKTAPSFMRPDGKFVQYIPLTASTPAEMRVAWMIALDRREGVAARLEPLDHPAAMEIALRGAWTADRRVSSEAFDALAACVVNARCHRLVFCGLREATELLDSLTPSSEAS